MNRASIEWEEVEGLPSRAACTSSADLPLDERPPAESFKSHKVATAEYLESRGMGQVLGLRESWTKLDESETTSGSLHGDLFMAFGKGDRISASSLERQKTGEQNPALTAGEGGVSAGVAHWTADASSGRRGQSAAAVVEGGLEGGTTSNEPNGTARAAGAGDEAVDLTAVSGEGRAAVAEGAAAGETAEDGRGTRAGPRFGGKDLLQKAKECGGLRHKLPLPPCASRRNPSAFWSDDCAFARQATQGCHPCHLRVLRADTWPSKTFRALQHVRGVGVGPDPTTSGKLQRLLPLGRTLQEECELGRVFSVDYRAELECITSVPSSNPKP